MRHNRTDKITKVSDRLAHDRKARRAARRAMENATAVARDVRRRGVRDAAQSRSTTRHLNNLARALGDITDRADAARRPRRWPWLLGIGAIGAGAAAVGMRRTGGMPAMTPGSLVVVRAVDVDVPVREAYNQWTQFEEFPKFMGGVDEVRQLDDTHLQWRARVGGVERQWSARVTEQHPDERVAWTSTGGGPDGVVTFHRLGDTSSRVTVQLAYEPDGVRDQVGHMLGVDSLRVKQDLARFKQLIEERQSATGAWRGTVEQVS
jgi:uncharacterized membrane protein